MKRSMYILLGGCTFSPVSPKVNQVSSHGSVKRSMYKRRMYVLLGRCTFSPVSPKVNQVSSHGSSPQNVVRGRQ
eukprot:scaffold477820_cov86-Attheya_sp.AAC.1